MKDIKEYTNEVFRRSEEKRRIIQNRRRAALLSGASVCLVLMLLIPVFRTYKNSSGTEKAPTSDLDISMLEAKIVTEESTLAPSSSLTEKLYLTLSALEEEYGEGMKYASPGEEGADENRGEAPQKNSISITFRAKDFYKSYSLQDNILTFPSGETAELEKEEINSLNKILEELYEKEN